MSMLTGHREANLREYLEIAVRNHDTAMRSRNQAEKRMHAATQDYELEAGNVAFWKEVCHALRYQLEDMGV